MLQDADPEFRRAGLRAVVAVGGKSPQAVPRLVDALADPDPGVRSLAARALAGVGPAAGAATPALAKSLADGAPEVRAAAAGALMEIGSAASPAAPSLLDALQDEASAVRLRAVGALIEVGVPRDKAAAEQLKAVLVARKGDPDFETEVLAALGEVGEPAVPVLVGLLTSEDYLPERTEAALARIGAPAVPALIPALADADWQVRWRSARTLARIGPAAAAAAQPLGRVLAEPRQVGGDKVVGERLARIAAAEALGAIRPQADLKACMPRFLAMLARHDSPQHWSDREEAAVLIAALQPGAQAKDAVGPLAKNLEREYAIPSEWNLTGSPARLSGSSINFIRALGAIGPPAEPALDLIGRGLKHDNPGVQFAAAHAWIRVNPGDSSQAESALLNVLRLRTDPPQPWAEAARLLTPAGPNAATAGVAVLKGHMGAADPRTRVAAAEALIVADLDGKAAAVEVLTALTKQRDTRLLAACALARASPPHRPVAVAALVEGAERADSEFRSNPWSAGEARRAAVAALRLIDPRAARRVGP
jgi:HEAT repeat protein